jgi:hypothetical protein
MDNSPTRKPITNDKAKKPFHQPKLIVYGTIREITKVVGNAGNMDGGTGMNQRTQP